MQLFSYYLQKNLLKRYEIGLISESFALNLITYAPLK